MCGGARPALPRCTTLDMHHESPRLTTAPLVYRAENLRKGARFVRRIYVLRLFGYAVGFFPLLLLLHTQHAHAWVIAAVASVCFVWPHLAYLHVRNARHPLLRERWNFMIDSINGGWNHVFGTRGVNELSGGYRRATEGFGTKTDGDMTKILKSVTRAPPCPSSTRTRI